MNSRFVPSLVFTGIDLLVSTRFVSGRRILHTVNKMSSPMASEDTNGTSHANKCNGNKMNFTTSACSGAKLAFNEPVSNFDPELFHLVQREKKRQREGLELIASENFLSRSVQQVLGSCLVNKYAEGLPGHRYYGGNEVIDEVERLCQRRALECFKLDPERWGVNVQPYSGSPANIEVYLGVIGPHGRLMGLDLADGGHLTHGYQSPTRKVSASSAFFESMPYRVDRTTGLVDYDQLAASASLFRPRLIVAGMSCYPREFDYVRMRQIADSCNAYLMADMAHISGLVAAGVLRNNPFDLCDVVTTTTHKTLRGPRGAIIFYRKGVRRTNKAGEPEMYDLERRINDAVFPGMQGGPHENQIGACAVALKEAMSEAFVAYQRQVLANVQTMCRELAAKGYKIVTGGSDVHLVLIDLRSTGVDGGRFERLMEHVGISVNKNAVPGDVSALRPGGIRVGSPALTSRGFGDAEFVRVSELLDRAMQLSIVVSKSTNGNTLEAFETQMALAEFSPKVEALANDVRALASSFPIPGFDDY